MLAFRLRQLDLEFLIEPDFFWQMIQIFADFFSTLDPKILPIPFPLVYLDAHHIVYGLVYAVLRWITSYFAIARGHFPNDMSYALGAALLTNITAYAAACTVFYAAIYRLIGHVVIAAAMAVGLFLAPQMLDINMARIDYLVTLPLMVVFYSSCVLAIGQEQRRHAIVLGFAMAFAATLKINGFLFGIIPALGALAAFQFNAGTIKRLARFTAISVGVFLVTYFVLMGRYLYRMPPLDIIQNYRAAIAQFDQWAPQMVGPTTYYNIELMMGSGLPFVALYLTCAAATIILAVWTRCRTTIFLALLFIVFSGAGMLSLKYDRGGYHLLPIFFAVIGFVAAKILNSRGHYIKEAAVAMMGLAFVASLWTSFEKYQSIVAQRELETAGLQAVKRDPRNWLLAHIPAGSTICIQPASDWTLPPLDGFNVINGPLTLSYLDLEVLARTPPPNFNDLQNSCSVIVTSDAHRDLYDSLMRKNSTEMADRWREFFEALNRRYPPIVFSSPIPARAKEVAINNLREKE